MAIMAINGHNGYQWLWFISRDFCSFKMWDMPKHLNLMPPQTHDVKTTPDVVPLSAAHTAPFVTPVAVTATTLATPAVTPSAVGPPPLQTLTVIHIAPVAPCRHCGPREPLPRAISQVSTCLCMAEALTPWTTCTRSKYFVWALLSEDNTSKHKQ